MFVKPLSHFKKVFGNFPVRMGLRIELMQLMFLNPLTSGHNYILYHINVTRPFL